MWYKECKNCDYYYKDETVEYCEVSLKDSPESLCKGKTEVKEDEA